MSHIGSSMPENPRQGFLYALTHPRMPGLVKIGCTRKHPIQRARELSAGSGVPEPFQLAFYKDFVDCFTAETLAHQAFADRRTNDSREFFEVPICEVVDFMMGLGASKGYQELASTGLTGGECLGEVETVRTPFSELFASFPDNGSDRQLTPEEQARCRALERSLSS